MFNAIEKMNPAFRPFAAPAGDVMTFQMGLKVRPAEMNWADPFRPDDCIPEHVKQAVIDCLNTTGGHYTFPTGDNDLRVEVAKRAKKLYGLEIDGYKNVVISPGSDNLFAFTMRPFFTDGEANEVMMPMPSYAHNFVVPPLFGGISVGVPTYAEDGFDLRIEEFEKRVTPRTKMVVITNPNNPTGTVYSRETLQKLADFVIQHDLIMVVDQAFEDTVYDGSPMTNIATLPGMQERTIVFGSLSKGFAMCGFRVAYVIAPEEIARMLQSISVFFLGAPNAIAQAGALAALRNDGFIEEYRQEYMARAKAIAAMLDETPHVSYVMPQGGFFFWINTSWYGTDQEVVEYLVQEAGVLVSGGSMCADPDHIRLIFGALKDREACLNNVRKIVEALKRHPKNNA